MNKFTLAAETIRRLNALVNEGEQACGMTYAKMLYGLRQAFLSGADTQWADRVIIPLHGLFTAVDGLAEDGAIRLPDTPEVTADFLTQTLVLGNWSVERHLVIAGETVTEAAKMWQKWLQMPAEYLLELKPWGAYICTPHFLLDDGDGIVGAFVGFNANADDELSLYIAPETLVGGVRNLLFFDYAIQNMETVRDVIDAAVISVDRRGLALDAVLSLPPNAETPGVEAEAALDQFLSAKVDIAGLFFPPVLKLCRSDMFGIGSATVRIPVMDTELFGDPVPGIKLPLRRAISEERHLEASDPFLVTF